MNVGVRLGRTVGEDDVGSKIGEPEGLMVGIDQEGEMDGVSVGFA